MALYFERRINKKRTPSDCFFGDFSRWIIETIIIEKFVKSSTTSSFSWIQQNELTISALHAYCSLVETGGICTL